MTVAGFTCQWRLIWCGGGRPADSRSVQVTYERESGKDVDEPKHGKVDSTNAPHVGGNTWAGGTGGRDTAGLGGKGGPYRLDAGHDVTQVSRSAGGDVTQVSGSAGDVTQVSGSGQCDVTQVSPAGRYDMTQVSLWGSEFMQAGPPQRGFTQVGLARWQTQHPCLTRAMGRGETFHLCYLEYLQERKLWNGRYHVKKSAESATWHCDLKLPCPGRKSSDRKVRVTSEPAE